MKKLFICLLTLLVFCCLVGCNNAGNEDTAEPSRLSYYELNFGDVTLGATEEEILALLGEPDSIIDGGQNWAITYYYPYSEILFLNWDGYIVARVDILSTSDLDTPRDIKIGDSFESVLAKFPQESDYTMDEQGLFYGNVPVGYLHGSVYGRVFDLDNNTLMVITTEESPLSYLTVVFTDDIVEKISFYSEP